MDKITLAKWLHINYEEIAKDKNWETQGNCQVPYEELPIENRLTMIGIAERILENKDLQAFFVAKELGQHGTI